MALPSADDLKALCERTPMGPWAAISDYPYISIVLANAPDEIFAPIVDIVDSTTDEPEVEPTHELIALAPDLARELLHLYSVVERFDNWLRLAARNATTPTTKNIYLDAQYILTELLEGGSE